jgi:hypothetical protein
MAVWSEKMVTWPLPYWVLPILDFPIRSKNSIYWAIPTQIYRDSQYIKISLLIEPFPQYLCFNIIDERSDPCSLQVGTSLCSVPFWPSTYTPLHPSTPLHTPPHPSTPLHTLTPPHTYTPPHTPPHSSQPDIGLSRDWDLYFGSLPSPIFWYIPFEVFWSQNLYYFNLLKDNNSAK